MATISWWFERIGPLASLGNAGALANAARACAEPRAAEAATDAALRRIPIALADPIHPSRRRRQSA